MAIKSTRRHALKYERPAGMDKMLADIESLLENIRGLKIDEKLQRRMLKHALWQVAMINGDFYGRYRSETVKTTPEQPIQRDHVNEMKDLVENLRSGSHEIRSIIEDSYCCIVTKSQHEELHKKGKGLKGWERYQAAKIPVWDALEDKQIT